MPFTVEAQPIPLPLIQFSTLLFAGAVPIGSRALKVAKPDADYDAVMLRSNFDKLDLGTDLVVHSIDEYFKVHPSTGKNYVFRKLAIKEGQLDLIVLEHQSDVDAVARAMHYLQRYNKNRLSIKQFRIAAFESALLQEGFTESWQNALVRFILTRTSKRNLCFTQTF